MLFHYSVPPEDDRMQHSAKASLSALALDNITYDTILASTTKGLHLDLSPQYLHPSFSPLPSTAPPNTPSSPQMAGYDSLASASAKIMESNKDVGRSQI
jgi:hypothetical protein